MKTVTILGANGRMGAQAGGLIAAFGGCRVHMLARSEEKARAGVEAAVAGIRSSVVRTRLIPGDMGSLEKAVSESDWVHELLPDNADLKAEMHRGFAPFVRPDAVVTSSSILTPAAGLAALHRNPGAVFGLNLANPPMKSPLAELVFRGENDGAAADGLAKYLTSALHRQVVRVADVPGRASHRLLALAAAEAAGLADGRVAFADFVLSFCGRSVPPLLQANGAGLPLLEAVLEALPGSDVRLPGHVREGAGFYKHEKRVDERGKKKIETTVYDPASRSHVPPPDFSGHPLRKLLGARIADADYAGLVEPVLSSDCEGMDLFRAFLFRHLRDAWSLVPDVTDQDGLDKIVGHGLGWTPPSAWLDLFGDRRDDLFRLMRAEGLNVPASMTSAKPYGLQKTLDYRQFFCG